MITIEDCAAFCEADARWVNHLARKESLTPIQAYAQAHALIVQSTFKSPLQRTPPDAEQFERKAA